MPPPRLVSQTPDFFALGGSKAVFSGQGFGCRCAKCDRQISAPFGYERRLIWCLYCGMEHGHVPMVEQPIGSLKWGFGVTREECAEDIRAIAAENLEAVQVRRARRYGHVWDLF